MHAFSKGFFLPGGKCCRSVMEKHTEQKVGVPNYRNSGYRMSKDLTKIENNQINETNLPI